jgi:hypothetical protein
LHTNKVDIFLLDSADDLFLGVPTHEDRPFPDLIQGGGS